MANGQSDQPTPAQPLRLQNAGLQGMYDRMRRDLESLHRELEADANATPPRLSAAERTLVLTAFNTLRPGLDPLFRNLDARLTGMANDEARAAAIQQWRDGWYKTAMDRIDAMRAQVNPAVEARRAGAEAAREFVDGINRVVQDIGQMFSGQPQAPAPGQPGVTTPAPAPGQPSNNNQSSNPFAGLQRWFNESGWTAGDGIGAAAGGLIGWLLGSMFGPGSWMSTIVSVLFAIGGAYIGGTQWGDTINGWMGGNNSGRNRDRTGTDERGRGRGRDDTSNLRPLTQEEILSVQETWRQVREERMGASDVRYDPEDRGYNEIADRRPRDPDRPGYRYI